MFMHLTHSFTTNQTPSNILLFRLCSHSIAPRNRIKQKKTNQTIDHYVCSCAPKAQYVTMYSLYAGMMCLARRLLDQTRHG